MVLSLLPPTQARASQASILRSRVIFQITSSNSARSRLLGFIQSQSPHTTTGLHPESILSSPDYWVSSRVSPIVPPPD
ncbi:hypothetical protein AGABI1DRAFT_128245 [Agaricus bisporus var. burnettii JB137-S8]|uniref:Uncharacterized protein n=1 Tax=Agaricus bisporus var. burnettii (strain JB137-S8 / ATCC MYA-4627 / FGSC 10392) TaxID=597362 RepID=K5XVC5_AGABU|nr:uncharacterized protein AGABI1DRAFT_128245 [Agaricus bisporus var. burnettii JB137-S8]EKM79080.1 hypothetical protein AGABI1DRAFT_128245 [Agaricus bisporus var. burnettii JB137-S8]